MDVELRTRRLVLRRFGRDDASRVARFLNNFAVAGNLATAPYPYAESDAVWWLERQTADAPPANTPFAIELPGEGVIGNCGFHLNANGGATLGYWLAQPFWNRGFMSEATEAVLDWFFEVSSSERIHSGVFHFNKASLIIQKKLGFTQTGESRVHCLARNEEVRHIDTELTRPSWAERQRVDEPKVIAVR